MKKHITDAVYDSEIERLSGVKGFPHLPKDQADLRKALRRVTDVDADFLHRVVSDVIDAGGGIPKPKEFLERAENLRRLSARKSAGRADCELCQGSGFVVSFRTVHPSGFEPYDASFAAVCTCRGGK